MAEPTLDQLIERFEMGQAYQTITANLGPSAQLVAFVNYNNVTDDSVGLESFDIMDQHEKILAEIAADPALEMACESFTGRLKSIGERFKNAVTFNRHDNLNDLASEPLVAKKSNIYVTKESRFATALTYIHDAFETLDYILPLIPGDANPEAWEKFYNEHVRDAGTSELGKRTRTMDRNWKAFTPLPKGGDFDQSGWTIQNFKKAIKDLGAAQVKFEDYDARVTDSCAHMQQTLELVRSSEYHQSRDEYRRRQDIIDSATNAAKKHDDPTKKHWIDDAAQKGVNEMERQTRLKQHQMLMKMVPAHVLSSMNKASACVDSATSMIFSLERWMYRSLIDVSRHFEIVHK